MTEKAVFGGGCFWCTEAVFNELQGVKVVKSGYARSTSSGQAGGLEKPPTYELVSSGTTDYVEVVHIEYDPNKISYHDLLTVFFASHDPTTVNRQGNDIGPQYRSVIFYTTDKQKEETEKFIAEINASDSLGAPVVTEVTPLEEFYEAEIYHQEYYDNNKNAPYCQVVINPKLEKVKKEFSKLLKKNG